MVPYVIGQYLGRADVTLAGGRLPGGHCRPSAGLWAGILAGHLDGDDRPVDVLDDGDRAADLHPADGDGISAYSDPSMHKYFYLVNLLAGAFVVGKSILDHSA